MKTNSTFSSPLEGLVYVCALAYYVPMPTETRLKRMKKSLPLDLARREARLSRPSRLWAVSALVGNYYLCFSACSDAFVLCLFFFLLVYFFFILIEIWLDCSKCWFWWFVWDWIVVDVAGLWIFPRLWALRMKIQASFCCFSHDRWFVCLTDFQTPRENDFPSSESCNYGM